MKKKVLTVLIVVISAPLAILSFIIAATFPWSLIYIGILFKPNPPAPAIKYAEFPFSITYEVDGEIVTVNDIYVCEYDGIDADESMEKYRKWKGYVKGTEEEKFTIIETDDFKIFCSLGRPSVYMGDYSSDDGSVPTNEITVYIRKPFSDDANMVVPYKESDYDEYGVKIISYELSDPIKNSFGK